MSCLFSATATAHSQVVSRVKESIKTGDDHKHVEDDDIYDVWQAGHGGDHQVLDCEQEHVGLSHNRCLLG